MVSNPVRTQRSQIVGQIILFFRRAGMMPFLAHALSVFRPAFIFIGNRFEPEILWAVSLHIIAADMPFSEKGTTMLRQHIRQGIELLPFTVGQPVRQGIISNRADDGKPGGCAGNTIVHLIVARRSHAFQRIGPLGAPHAGSIIKPEGRSVAPREHRGTRRRAKRHAVASRKGNPLFRQIIQMRRFIKLLLRRGTGRELCSRVDIHPAQIIRQNNHQIGLCRQATGCTEKQQQKQNSN